MREFASSSLNAMRLDGRGRNSHEREQSVDLSLGDHDAALPAGSTLQVFNRYSIAANKQRTGV